MAFLQPNWDQVLERFGYPTLVLFVVILALWKGLWPYIKRQLDQADEQRRAAQQILSEQLTKAEGRIEKADAAHGSFVKTHEDFVRRVTEALEEQNRVNHEMAQGMKIMLERTKHL